MEIEVGKMYAVQAGDYEPPIAVKVTARSVIGGYHTINLSNNRPLWLMDDALFLHELVLTTGSQGGSFLANPRSTIFELGPSRVDHIHDDLDSEVHEALHSEVAVEEAPLQVGPEEQVLAAEEHRRDSREYQPTEGMSEPPGQ